MARRIQVGNDLERSFHSHVRCSFPPFVFFDRYKLRKCFPEISCVQQPAVVVERG